MKKYIPLLYNLIKISENGAASDRPYFYDFMSQAHITLASLGKVSNFDGLLCQTFYSLFKNSAIPFWFLHLSCSDYIGFHIKS